MPAGVSGIDEKFEGISEFESVEVFEGVSVIVHRMKTEKNRVCQMLLKPSS
jgi:hypothetical protein